jgi:hypothetical protein
MLAEVHFESRSTMAGAVDKSFITAFLLSGSASQAEAAVLESIHGLNADDQETEAALLLGAVSAAIRTNVEVAFQPLKELHALKALPVELRRVLQLATVPRQCYVLRALAAWSREFCAETLGLTAAAIDDEVCAAARTIARIAEDGHGELLSDVRLSHAAGGGR